jgi:nitroreductase
MDLQTVDHLLTTTRSVRKRLDFERPVPRQVLEECLELALQAPTGSNLQQWQFLVISDEQKKARLADIYRKAFKIYASAPPPGAQALDPQDLRAQRSHKVVDSAVYLAENLHRVPYMVIPCYQGRVEQGSVLFQASFYGSILPAAWSLMLALRSRGLGSAWTTLHLMFEQEAAELLGIPSDVTQTCLLPVAYFQGEDFKKAARLPLAEVLRWEAWD